MPFDLKGRRILVIRPRPQGEILCEMISNAGGTAIYLPTIEIVPRPFVQDQKYDWLIFISPNAVKHYSFISQPETKIAAIGPGTANELTKRNQRIDFLPQENFSTEGLLEASPFQKMAQQKIAIIKGVGGRETLAEVLKERGASVTEVSVYERVLPKVNASPVLAELKAKSIDGIVATSVEGLRNLETLIGEKNGAYLHPVALIVISERMAKEAKTLGFQLIYVAKTASHEAILKVLEDYKDAGRK